MSVPDNVQHWQKRQSNTMIDKLTATILFYPTLAYNALLARVLNVRNWWDEVDQNVVLGALPFASDIAKLAEIGVGAVVNTCEEYPGPVAEYEKHHVEQLRVPTVDFTHPTLESVERAVAFMEQQVAAGKRIYVHCKAGRARSATVVACWLIKNDHMTAAEAQEKMLQARSHVNKKIAQRPVVKAFEKKYLVGEQAVN